MGLSIGIVGLPNVGKSTLFNALTAKGVPAENYPFCTIDPSVGIVPVPDPRLQKLATLSSCFKIIPAVIEFVDIAGLVKGASEGAGLGNQFLQHIRETDAILEVVRIFDDADITHVEGEIDPVHDIEVINLELVLTDLSAVAKRLQSVERDAKRGVKEAILEQATLQKVDQTLSEGKLASTTPLTSEERHAIRALQLLTMKPIMYALNKKAGGHNLDEMNDGRYQKLIEFLDGMGAEYATVDAGIEGELRDVAGEDKETLRREFGVLDDGLDGLIRAGYRLLGLMTFLTTGEVETRAWTVKIGSTAPEAGAAIHTDFRDTFIRAEVVAYDKLIEAGSYATAREKGWVRTEGKEYIVKDGDVIEFKV
ncbi:MAG: redox-regulated ATPase YchF [Candidatus Pacebacteria bacterium]|nr:redox-regulated ATPase YchF [Candidatus Paceibacterota bacterium]MBP9831930.1 redox-regulated ATPase YchF [Candidatus Paceibacterota bacterium]